MNYVHVIADTHFGHKKIIEFENAARPYKTIEEHDRDLIARWNAVVQPKDTVWHLGDVLFGRHSFDCLKELNGVKKLVMGNHDHYPVELYLQYFTKVMGSAKYGSAILTHIPIHPSQFYRFSANVHGHLHSKKLDDPRYTNVSAEQIGLAPILLHTILPK